MRFFHRLGFGIQSPWAYDLVTNVLFAHTHYYAFDSLKHRYPRHAKAGEQLFRLTNLLKPSAVAIIGNSGTTQAEAFRSYLQATSKSLQIDFAAATPSQTFDMLLILDPQQFNFSEWASSKAMTESTCIVMEDISKSGKALWQAILQHHMVTATFDIGSHRGIAFFDQKKTKMNYKV